MPYNLRMTPNDLLKHFGSKAEIARAFGVKLPSVTDWFATGEIPEVRQYQAELMTSGALRASRPADRRKVA